MDPKLQLRLQRSGWDLAAAHYQALWAGPLAAAHARLLACAELQPGETVLDVACGTGVVSLAAARAVGRSGSVHGIDLSGCMVEQARGAAAARGFGNVTFERMEAGALAFPEGCFDVVLCALGLMYMPDVPRALAEMRRVLRPGGRAALAVWGDRTRCGWSDVFDIVDAEVQGDVCPLFFGLSGRGALASGCEEAGFRQVTTTRLPATLRYESANEACSAAFLGGPVALAWSRFDDDTRERVCTRYVDSIKPWRTHDGYEIPAEFVVVKALA